MWEKGVTMNSRMRFHLTAIAAIVVTVLAVQFFIQKPSAPAEETTIIGDRFIIIYEADWGLNCNPFIEKTLAARRTIPFTSATGEKPQYQDGQPQDLSVQKANNALLALSEACNTRTVCQFKATTELLGAHYRNCNKDLRIAYRCFEYDKLRTLKSGEGKRVTIDCRNV
jgi:hypothetical protein